MHETDVVKGKQVLEIGTGTGLLATCALQAGASHAVATDINSNAVMNARFNGALLGFAEHLEVRQVALAHPGAYEVIHNDEQFDVILSNPPWVNRVPQRIDEFALYDASFHLMRTLLDGLPKHLRPGGKAGAVVSNLARFLNPLEGSPAGRSRTLIHAAPSSPPTQTS